MKINRFIALAAIALLVVGVMGAVSVKVFALDLEMPFGTSAGCADDAAEATEVPSAAETDKVDAECGEQNGADEHDAVEAPDTETNDDKLGGQQDEADSAEAPDNEQDGEQADGPDNGTEVPEILATATP